MKTLVNICGAGRSGTTVVDLMLGNDPNAFSLGEVYAWHRPWRTHHFKIVCSCGEEPCPHWENIKDFDESFFHRQAFEKLDVDFLIDSSKDINWVIDNNLWANQQFNVVNVLLWKHPESLVHSYIKRGHNAGEMVSQFIKYYKRFFDSELPFIAVSYEWLFSDMSKNFPLLCQYVGVEYFQGKEDFWEEKHHHLFGSRGTREQLKKEVNAGGRTADHVNKQADVTPDGDVQTLLFNNKELQKLVSKLRTFDIQRGPFEGSPKKPYWYYGKKLKSRIKRKFPDTWKYDQ